MDPLDFIAIVLVIALLHLDATRPTDSKTESRRKAGGVFQFRL